MVENILSPFLFQPLSRLPLSARGSLGNFHSFRCYLVPELFWNGLEWRFLNLQLKVWLPVPVSIGIGVRRWHFSHLLTPGVTKSCPVGVISLHLDVVVRKLSDLSPR